MAKLRSGKGDNISPAPPTSSAQTPCPLMEFLDREELVATSRLDEFRRFFDLQIQFWDEFRLKLKAWVSSFSSWVSVLNMESERRKIAETFLEENGPKFWGSDKTRQKYLMQESIESRDLCLWPERKEAMIRGLMLLLEKTAKLTKERSADSSLSTIPNLSNMMTQSPLTPTPSRLIDRNVLLQSQTPNNCSPARPLPLHLALRNPTPATTTLSQENFASIENEEVFMAGTSCLVREDGVTDRPSVCTPFQHFVTSERFLDVMAESCGLPLMADPSALLLHRESPVVSRRVVVSAMAWPRWTTTSFPIRLGYEGDMQVLMNKVKYAWQAKSRGEFPCFEFEIEVVLVVEEC
ncbi:hypothetical protein N7510_010645 [Penicillium lagena]|uniref:uncharacterized protein n=1 Tax=Penicillium lagena TaxID=94218 RepID=UPI0025421B49|nr:uncharacterized protein N7510_010645 [Penicillium lagena]KAJ5601111.1 hypothetical protein N7510_010645 [Penicillium lagena]